MSSDVFHFTPREELGPQGNLEAFIEKCRKAQLLDALRQFDKNVWDIGQLKGRNNLHRAVFSTMEGATANAYEPWLPQPFLDFAKATLVYLADSRPVVNIASRVSALRFLEAALREWNKDSRPTAVNIEILDTAAELARNSVSARVAYRIAGQLEFIAKMMCEKGLISLRQEWRHGLRRPNELGSRISKDALQARQEKLPSAAALRALASIFQEAIEPIDISVSSYMALMMSAPERVNEVLRLTRRCVVQGDGRFAGKTGLRWPGSKGANDTIKWLPSAMAPVAEQAINNLLKVSTPAQHIAAWYTAHPDSLYLHDGAAHLRDKEILTLKDIRLLLWGNRAFRTTANIWAQLTNNLAVVSLGGRNIGFRFKDVEKAVLAMLPVTFPYVPGAPGLLCKDAICISRTNEMHASKSIYLCMFTCVDQATVTNPLSNHRSRASIFHRFGYTEDDGSPIEIISHSLRHYLNMLAQMGQMTSAEIALFSGRKEESQNRAYDHMSSDEVQEPISRALKAGMTDSLVTVEQRQLISRTDFPLAKPTAAHTTEYGWCMHDFASEPCQMYRDCINCEEQECIKGDAHKQQNLQGLKMETELLLKTAKEALGEEEYNADTWVTHQARTLERVNALLNIFRDPEIPVGARVRLNIFNAPLIAADETRPNYRGKTIEKALPK